MNGNSGKFNHLLAFLTAIKARPCRHPVGKMAEDANKRIMVEISRRLRSTKLYISRCLASDLARCYHHFNELFGDCRLPTNT
mmetsp:Transcript_63811/g.99426  ORF Transcript_63811/g.99426 Transcript_63811/m.99426 type:complete len:82 (-) Transcript_63811:113-358(-)